MEGQQSETEKQVTTREVVQELVNEVAQLKADKVVLEHRIAELRRENQQATVSPTGADSATAALVTPFSGKSNEDVEAFFTDLATAAKLGAWSDAHTLLVAKLKVVGDAKTHVLCKEELRNASTLEAFKQELCKRYKNLSSDRYLREQLSVAKQRQNESVVAFADRIRALNVRTYQLTNCEESNVIILREAENRVLDAFLRGLQPEMSRRVRAGFPKTLEEAVSAAVALHEIDVATQVSDKRTVFNNSRVCHRCGKAGHISRDCRQQFCTFCKKVGHAVERCYARGKGNPQKSLNVKGNAQATANRRSQ